MKNTVVIGAQWGDEGKAKITDLLAKNADLIICESSFLKKHNSNSKTQKEGSSSLNNQKPAVE